MVSENDERPDATRTASTIGAPRSSGRRRGRSAAPDAPSLPALEAGATFGPWTLVGALGHGGFAEVWEAIEPGTGRHVALKILTEMRAGSDEAVTRFEQEGRLAASLSSPRCVFVLGAQAVDGVPVIAMELMPGGSLQDILKTQGPLHPETAVEHVLDVIEGLEAAQAAGIVHRDVKPSNCFIDRDGRVRIGDFGISKSLEAVSKLTATGSFLGTPAYASPEQLRGRPVDFRSDVYSVGATLYALLTGKAPFESTNAGDLLAKIVGEKVPPMGSHGVRVPRGLESVVMKALSKDPADRHASYEQLRRALLPFRRTIAEPAGLGRRFVAWLIDSTLAKVPLAPLVAVSTLDDDHVIVECAHAAAAVAWFAVSERRWGVTLGKKMLGLRVVAEGRLPLSWRQALTRALIPATLLSVIPPLIGAIPAGDFQWIPKLVAFLFFCGSLAALLWPLRTQKGAMLQDVLTDTSVVSSAPRRVRAARSLVSRVRDAPPEIAEEPQSGATRGSFTLGRTLATGEGWSLHSAHDPSLGRRAWVIDLAGPEPPAFQDIERATRLRWLQSGEADGRKWVALEAPTGASLPSLVARHGQLHWGDVRLLLAALMEELAVSLEEQDLPARICLRQLWVDARGHLRLIPLPIDPDPQGSDPCLPREAWPELVHRMVLLCLDGEWPPAGDIEGRRPKAILPEHAGPFVDAICDRPRRLLPEQLRVMEAWLDRVRELPHELTRGARVRALAWFGIGPALLAIGGGAYARIAEEATWLEAASKAGTAAWIWSAFWAVAVVAVAFVLRGGWGFRREGIAVQDLAGRPASRARCAARALIAMALPLVGLAGVAVQGAWAAWGVLAEGVPAVIVGPLVLAAGAAFSAWRIDRGLPELLTGTRLVAQ